MGTILTTSRHRYVAGLVIILVLNKTQRTNYLGFLTSLILLPPYITLRHLITPARPHHYTFREHLCISIIRSVAAMRIKYCRQMMSLSAKVATLIYRPTTSRIISTKCAGIWYGDADLDDNAAVILYVHGGGYCMGIPQQWPESHQRMVDDLIRMGVPCRILALEYSLAPETAFPIAIQQVLLAYSYLTDDLHIRSSRIILAGDSAGGTLCIATALRMRDDGLSMPAALVAISPWVDMYMTSPSYITNRDDDLLLDTLLPQCSENYLQGHNMKDPSVSPIYADLTGLPPMCINAGGREIFYDDIMLFIDKARAAGVQVTPIIDSSMVHTYPLWPLAFSSKAYHALHLMSTFMSTILKARRVECNKEGSHHLTRNRFSDSHLI